MGHTEQTLMGPDFAKGVDISTLKPGEPTLGYVGESPVLLIRENEKFYAIGAKCTHYGADLMDGEMSDGIIRCPWHHACFDVKTGDAVKAPALNPLPCWRTEVVQGQVFVREQIQSDEPKRVAEGKEHFVIIGSGAAGHAAAEQLRKLGFDGRVTVLSADTDLPYDRPNLSKDYLAGNAPEEWMPLRDEAFFSQKKISVHLNTTVSKLDTKAKVLTLANGEAMSYDKCLMATGGSPFKPKIGGIDLPHVHVLRSFADCRSLIASLGQARKVAIVGAGFIGLEAAAALKSRGLDVTVVAPARFPLEHVVGAEVGAFLKSLHEENGVHFDMGKTVYQIDPGQIILSDNSVHPADVVLVATGISLSSSLAQEGGLDFENGILVNEYLETSAPDVFAAGDIARYPSPQSGEPVRIEHWVVAQRQGQTAAANMMGQKRKYAEIPFFWSQQFDVALCHVGHASSTSDIWIYGRLADRNCAVAYLEKDEVRAVLTIGRDQQSLEIEKAFERNDQQAIKNILDTY